MLPWLRLRFGRCPIKIHSIAFHPWRDGWRDVVITFGKDHPARVIVHSVELSGMVRWLPVVEQLANFTLVADGKLAFRFGVISPRDFEALLVRLEDLGTIDVRLHVGVDGITARRKVRLSRDSVDHSAASMWPPRAATEA